MSETEFKVKDPKAPTIPAMRLMINSLRNAREEHPAVDTAVESLPIVGALGAGLDITDPNASNLTKGLALASVVPGGKLMGTIAKRLRGYERKIPAKVVDKLEGVRPPEPPETTFTPEDIFQKPDVVMTPEEREAARKATNEAYAKQLLEEEAGLQDLGAVSELTKANQIRKGPTKKSIINAAEKAGQDLYSTHKTGLILDKDYKELPYEEFIKDGGPFFDTYDYAFHPSTGKGFDVADTPFSRKYLDKDGNLYIGGGFGIRKITDVPDEKKLREDMAKYLREEQGFSEEEIVDHFKRNGMDE